VLWKESSVGEFVTQVQPGVDTLWKVFQWRVAQSPDLKAAGWRPVLETSFETDTATHKQFEKLVLGPYEWLSYREWSTRVEHMASGLHHIAGFKAKDKMLVFAETQKDWMTGALATWRQNGVLCTIYATIGADAVLHACKQTKARVVCTDARLLKTIAQVASGSTLKHVIVLSGDAASDDVALLRKAKIAVHTLEEVLDAGSAHPVEENHALSGDKAVIMCARCPPAKRCHQRVKSSLQPCVAHRAHQVHLGHHQCA
jgi:long-chain acyl-CoA synthetase